jgi:hypothetical protein
MWKKIHSNRDPRDTLYSELRREFRPRLDKTISYGKGILAAYPRAAFAVMTALLLVSGVLSFSVLRHPEKKTSVLLVRQPAVVSDGFTRIMQAADGLTETLRLKSIVDSLTCRKTLNGQDSLLLDSVLTRLQHIRQPQK